MVRRCKGGAVTIWIRALIIETLKNALSPSAHGGCSKKTAICKEGESHQTLEWLAPDLGLQANRNNFLLFISSSVYDILLWQLEQTLAPMRDLFLLSVAPAERQA